MFSQKQMEKAMKRMGIKSEEIDATEVIIRCRDKDIVVREPAVSKINMAGQETFQVMGKISEVFREKFSAEDVKLVTSQTGCSEDDARKVLDETGDIAEAIIRLKNNA